MLKSDPSLTAQALLPAVRRLFELSAAKIERLEKRWDPGSGTPVFTVRGDYCMSKAGLAMAAKLWAARLAADGVQVYELRPGIMATDMTAAVKDKYDKMIADGLIPQGRWGTAEDVGRAVSALLKGSLPFSTGEVINIDGGLHLERL